MAVKRFIGLFSVLKKLRPLLLLYRNKLVFATAVHFQTTNICWQGWPDRVEPLMGLHSNGRLLSLAHKYVTRVEVNGNCKHSSLFRYGNNYCLKKFNTTGP
jgi:hypothetical protein